MFSGLIDRLLQFVDLFKFWVVLDEYQRGIMLRLGKFHKELAPGITWCIPFSVDRCIEIPVVTKTTDLRQSFLTLKDGATVCVSVVVRYNIRDVKKALLEVWHIDDVLRDSVFGNVSSRVRKSTWDELQTPEFEENLAKDCRKQAFKYGVEIENVVLSDLCRANALALLGNSPATAAVAVHEASG